MKKIQSMALTAPVLLAALLVGACANRDTRPATSSTYPVAPRQYSAAYGVVDQIEVVRGDASGGIGAGTVIGGVVGGAVGNQVGKGRGNTAATIAGAVGGAVAGHELEKNRSAASDSYRVRIRLDDGSYQTIAVTDIADLRVGERVRVESDRIYHAD